MEKIVIIDYANVEVRICNISKHESTESFFDRKGINQANAEWIRGEDIKIVNEE